MLKKLGTLDHAVMEIMWEGGEQTVGAIVKRLGNVTKTTVLSALDRLYWRGLLARCKNGRKFIYKAKDTRDAWYTGQAKALLSELLNQTRDNPGRFLSYIVDAIGETDVALLEKLEQIVQTRRNMAGADTA